MAQEIESIALSSTTPSVGDVLTYTVTPAGAVTDCLWYRDSVNSANVIGNTASYTVQKPDMGHTIICVATGNHDSNTNPNNPWYGTEQAVTSPVKINIAAEKAAHFRGGSGITITPDGDCEHSEGSKVAKINWDGVGVVQEYNGTVRDPKWFRKVKAGARIDFNISDDVCTVSSVIATSGTGISITTTENSWTITNTGLVSFSEYPTGEYTTGEQGTIYIGRGLESRHYGGSDSIPTGGRNGLGVKTVQKTVFTNMTASGGSITFTTETINCVDIS